MTTAGLDLLRGRPTPAISSTEAKLQQRKLDALRRGVHKITDTSTLPYGIHMIGIGGAGTRVVQQMLQDSPDDLLATNGSRMTALAVDISNGNSEIDSTLNNINNLTKKFPSDRSQIETISLSMPAVDELQDSLSRYRDFLKLEYPLYHWNQDYEPWLSADYTLPKVGEKVPRALAKAIYGRAYYDGERPLAAALRKFAKSVEATNGDMLVCIVFGLGGGTGSGMALDLARHLSNGIFGRRVLVTGIGIAPCGGDLDSDVGAKIYPLINELDCLCDETKNIGVVRSCGDLYKNPFTAGFLTVPQEPVWQSMGNLADTHQRVNEEIASLLTLRHGANLWEVLRLLNWVAAPSTQHSAARTPWGAQWMHMLGFSDLSGQPVGIDDELPKQLGLLPSYAPEFIELRVDNAANVNVQTLSTKLQTLFSPEAAPSIAEGGKKGSVQFTLPRVAKTDMRWFFEARDKYEAAPVHERLLNHALLLEQGILLCEPSTRIEGMAGAGVGSSKNWVAVPMSELRGEPGTTEHG
jgi:hypothetical protein